jgi:hypothetical protein
LSLALSLSPSDPRRHVPLPSARFSRRLLPRGLLTSLSLSFLPTHQGTEPAGTSPTTARARLLLRQEFEAKLCCCCRRAAHMGMAARPCSSATRRWRQELLLPPPGLSGTGAPPAVLRLLGGAKEERESQLQGSSASPPAALRLPRKGCTWKRKGNALACAAAHAERRWREDLPTASPTCQPRAGPPLTSSAAKIHLQALAKAAGSSSL